MSAIRDTIAAHDWGARVRMMVGKKRADAAEDDEDADLMVRIARGDRFAYASFMDRHLDRTLAVAQRVLGRRQDAEDIVQETFLRVWLHANRWEPGHGRVTTWLYRITMNLCLDQKRRPSHDPLDDVPEPPDPAQSAEEHLARLETDRALGAAIAALPDRQRAVLALTYQGGLSNKETARVLNIGVGAVESHLVRAKKALRAALTAYGSAEPTAAGQGDGR